MGLSKGFCWKGSLLLLQCVFGAGQSCLVCCAGYILPPHLSWLWKGTIGNTLSNLDLHRSVSAPQCITNAKSAEPESWTGRSRALGGSFLVLNFFFCPVASEGHVGMMRGGNFPALQLGWNCLWKGMRLAQVQVQCRQGLQMQKALMAGTLFPFLNLSP